MKDKIRVTMRGQGRTEDFTALTHEIKGYPGGTYHIFEMSDGRTVYYNDFGIQIIEVTRL